MLVKFWGRGFQWIVLILGLGLAIELVSWFVAESLWFQELGYSQAFWLPVQTRAWLWAIALFLTAGILLYNLALAERFADPKYPEGIPGKRANNDPLPLTHSSILELRWLLPIALGLGILIGLMLLHYSQVAASYWHPDIGQFFKFTNVPPRFQPEVIWQQVQQFPSQRWQLGLLVGFAIALIVVPKFLWAIAVLISLGFGLVLSNNWAKVLLFFHSTPFNSTDPLFNRDLSFYAFALPVWELLEFWLMGIFLYAFAAVSLVYLLSGNSLSEGRFSGFSAAQQRHLYALGGTLMLSLALSYWLRRYELVYSMRGVAYGASYTDVNVQLPAYTGLSLLAIAIATFLLWRAIFWQTKKAENSQNNLSNSSQRNHAYPWPLIYSLIGYILAAFVAGWLYPAAVQRTIVQPNELVRERPYIDRSIAFTRAAFDLENIEVKTFDPQDKLTAADLANNSQTIRNIRLWDSRPLLDTNRQLQQIRLYYKFANADIDRYTLKKERSIGSVQPPKNSQSPIPNSQSLTEKQQVILAARELDYNEVPQEAQTWVNKHLVYTHGYGFTMSPVNTVGPGGLPDYFVKDIGVGSQNLRTTSDRIRASIPIGHPRIYYGEISDTYVMAPTHVKELDYPSGEENVYNTYDGAGGVTIGNWVKRLLFASYLRDWQMMLTPEFSQTTKVLMRRNIRERVEAIAPFLRYDSDPYLVVARANLYTNNARNASAQKPPDEDNYLYWIIDGYTTSDRYPYSDPGPEEFNYIRNSVKVAIDAYNGNVAFYIADPSDPIIKSWNAIFPNLIKPFNEMPASLRSHIRYPTDLFNIQSQRLLTYHMTDAQVFYNRDDQWRIPNEIYGSESQRVEPYYLITRLPTAASEEFILLLPFTPASRNNLIAWLAARSDGTHYGKLLLYQFPKQQLIYGPEQIEARINQDPAISQQISLWNRQGSRAIQGNLLVIPIEESLLYVEPLYLEAAQTGLPTLVRVIVAYENSIAMAETLDGALDAIFRREKVTTPVILSPGDEIDPSLGAPLAPR